MNFRVPHRLANLAFRIALSASKLFLILLVFPILSSEEIGQYGLVSGFIAWIVLIGGLDLYQLKLRELDLTSKDGPDLSPVIQMLTTTLPLLPFWAVVLSGPIRSASSLPQSSVWLICLLCVSEYLNQEICRLLIATGRVNFASSLLFLRQGVWIFLLAAARVFLREEEVTITSILFLWTVFSGSALILGINSLRIPWGIIAHARSYRIGERLKDFRRVIFFWVSTASVATTAVIGRYLLTQNHLLKQAGDLLLLTSYANWIIAIAETTIVPYSYARALRESRSLPAKELVKNVNMDSMRAVAIGCASVIPVLLISWLAEVSGMPRPDLSLLITLCITNLFSIRNLFICISLYCFKLERELALGNGGGLILCLIASYFAGSFYDIHYAVVINLSSTIAVWAWFEYSCWRGQSRIEQEGVTCTT